MKNRYEDKDLTKVLGLLAESKRALDEACEAADAYAEADDEVRHIKEMIEDEKEWAATVDREIEPDYDLEKEMSGLADRLKRAVAARDAAKKEFVSHALTLDDELGSAIRVSDHYNGKKYPLGMTPL